MFSFQFLPIPELIPIRLTGWKNILNKNIQLKKITIYIHFSSCRFPNWSPSVSLVNLMMPHREKEPWSIEKSFISLQFFSIPKLDWYKYNTCTSHINLLFSFCWFRSRFHLWKKIKTFWKKKNLYLFSSCRFLNWSPSVSPANWSTSWCHIEKRVWWKEPWFIHWERWDTIRIYCWVRWMSLSRNHQWIGRYWVWICIFYRI